MHNSKGGGEQQSCFGENKQRHGIFELTWENNDPRTLHHCPQVHCCNLVQS